jgi:hypothetical protein
MIVDRRFRGAYCLRGDGGSTHLWYVGRQLFYTAVHPRRQFWTSLTLWRRVRESESRYGWRSVSQSVLVSSPFWDSWPDF